MWVFLTGGFYSIVADRNRSENLLVRGRCMADMRSFLKLLPSGERPEVVRTPHADYPYRMSVPRDLVARLMAQQVERVDYDNFKGVGASRGASKKHAARRAAWIRRLHEVWGSMRKHEDRAARRV